MRYHKRQVSQRKQGYIESAVHPAGLRDVHHNGKFKEHTYSDSDYREHQKPCQQCHQLLYAPALFREESDDAVDDDQYGDHKSIVIRDHHRIGQRSYIDKMALTVPHSFHTDKDQRESKKYGDKWVVILKKM